MPAGTKSLTVAYVGMKPRTMEISKNGTVNVVLEWDDSNLNEAIRGSLRHGEESLVHGFRCHDERAEARKSSSC